jgi:hypothetical protein
LFTHISAIFGLQDQVDLVTWPTLAGKILVVFIFVSGLLIFTLVFPVQGCFKIYCCWIERLVIKLIESYVFWPGTAGYEEQKYTENQYKPEEQISARI